MSERVLVAGASGYLGRRLVPRLLAGGRTVRALVRGGAARAARMPHLEGCEIAAGDVTDAASCRRAAEGVDTVIHLVGIIKETGGATFESIHVDGTVALVQAARHAGAGRFLYVSAIGARPDAPSAYWRTKAEAERIVRTSGLTWLVVRPSLVLARDGEFYAVLKQLTAVPLVPILGPGTSRLQCVHADDLAELQSRALDRPAAWNRVVDAVGPEAMPFTTLVRRVARGLRRPVVLVHVPLALARPLVELADRLVSFAPITPGQLAMLGEDSTGDAAELERLFGLRVRPVDDVLGDRAAGAA